MADPPTPFKYEKDEITITSFADEIYAKALPAHSAGEQLSEALSTAWVFVRFGTLSSRWLPGERRLLQFSLKSAPFEQVLPGNVILEDPAKGMLWGSKQSCVVSKEPLHACKHWEFSNRKSKQDCRLYVPDLEFDLKGSLPLSGELQIKSGGGWKDVVAAWKNWVP